MLSPLSHLFVWVRQHVLLVGIVLLLIAMFGLVRDSYPLTIATFALTLLQRLS